jgi:hypothetical protein
MKLKTRIEEFITRMVEVNIEIPVMPQLGKLDHYEEPTQEELDYLERRFQDGFNRQKSACME